MKYLLVMTTFMFAICIASCALITPEPREVYPKYELTTTLIVPDSLIIARAEFVTETVKAATNNLKTVDYEDTDDLVEEASEQAQRLFAVKVVTLKRYNSDVTGDYKTLDPMELTATEDSILKSKMKK